MVHATLKNWFAFAILLCFALIASTGTAGAQPRAAQKAKPVAARASAPSWNQAPHYARGWSSSLDSNEIAELRTSGLAPAAASAASPAAPSPTVGQTYGNTFWHPTMHGIAAIVGGGFNAPQSNYIDWGGNVLAGVGMHFSSHLAGLVEFRFVDTGLSNKLIQEAGSTGGDVHMWGFTLDPVVDLMPRRSNDLYLTGGGGFYRKVTQFTDPSIATYCDYFFGCYNTPASQVVGDFSSNQGGWNAGMGYYHRFSGMYGRSGLKFFAEARYLDVLSPAVTTQPDGLGSTTVSADTILIPVSFGFAW